MLIPLLLPLFHHITFDGNRATVYSNHGASLQAHVEESASFLFQPFELPRRLSTVGFRWRLKTGTVNVKDAASEAAKSGDDAAVRIGFLVSGKAPLVPFFAPAWIKAVQDVAKLPAEKMVFIVAGARHPPGTTWDSPYDSDILLLAPLTIDGADGWHYANHKFPSPLNVVGLWIMSDGDDTHSRFDVEVADLEFK